MSRVKNAVKNEFQLLEQMRGELALQAHLFKADVKVRWESLESKWEDLKEHLGRAQVAAGDAGRSIDASSKALADSIMAGYVEIRNAVKH